MKRLKRPSRSCDHLTMFNSTEDLFYQKHCLDYYLEHVSVVLLKDKSLIPKIHEWFYEVQEKDGKESKTGNVYLREQFIYIILLLYDHDAIICRKFPHQTRNIIASLYHLKKGTPISVNLVNAIEHYKLYSDFRENVERSYISIMKHLAEEKLLPWVYYCAGNLDFIKEYEEKGSQRE